MPSLSRAVQAPSPVALTVRLDAQLVTAVTHQLGGRVAVASVPHVAAACQALAKQEVNVVIASTSRPFWDRHVLAEQTTRADVKLCFVPTNADASGIVDLLGQRIVKARYHRR